MSEVVWTLVGLLAASTFGNLYWLGSKIDGLGTRVDSLDARLTSRIDELDDRLTIRIDHLDARLTSRIDDLDARLSSRMDGIGGRLDGIATRLDMHTEEHRR